MSGFLIVVDTTVEAGSGPADPEEWYARHAEEVAHIPGVTRVERYWSVDDVDETSHHLALYHVAEPPAVMAERFSRAKAEGRLTGSPFATRSQRAFRAQPAAEA